MRQLFDASWNSFYVVALLFLSATAFISCKESIEKTDALRSTDSLATQMVRDMKMVETKYGKVSMRMEALLMESYSLLAEPYDIFPKGIKVMGYTPEGELEIEIMANEAIHKTKNEQEKWEAYGNVVIINHIKNQTMNTDTLYWDKVNQKIYTHVYVRLFSPEEGFMQGIGMESDEKAYNVRVLRPFDSYGVILRDTVAHEVPLVDELLP
jgi:LPS export ABC transporter protein LptC